jgi:sugar/nucleoside kinase (ribokinase family)
MSPTLRPVADCRFDVVGLGAGTLDHLCVVRRPPAADGKQPIARHVVQPGGQVPTALVALSRWGLRTAYAGVLADDEGGALQERSLREEAVDVAGCPRRPHGRTRLSIILVDEVTGARSVLWHPPRDLDLGAGELERERLTAGRALLVDADDAEAALTAASWAQEAGVLVVLDADEPGPRAGELVACCDVAIVPAPFPPRLTGRDALRPALREMRARGPRLVAATLGGGGVLACDADGFHYVPAVPVAAVDTTSAGDLFHAGTLYGLLQGWGVDRTLRFAAAAAALECAALGGRAAIPALERVYALAHG